VMIGCYLLLSRTTFGLRVRATLENPALARASGISTAAMYGTTFAFGAALAGLAGALLVPVFSLFADLGIRFLIQGFVAVMVGGVGSFIGPVAGAAVIGTLSAALPWVMAPVVADILVFVLAIVFIKFRPQGLLSGKGV
jgi:branched-chain amino acid transport system permease protein